MAATTPSRVIAVWTLALAGLILLDAAIFRTRLYPPLIEPVSYAGWFEFTLRRELLAQRESGDNLILTVGNSRFGYSPKLANAITPPTGYIFRNGGVAGSNPRGWYYMLRDLDPQANRYRAIVFGVDDYNDNTHVDQADYALDLYELINRLRWRDVLDFPWTYVDPAWRWSAFRGSVLKGAVYQRDFLAFLDDPANRREQIRRNLQYWEDSHLYEFFEQQKNVVGLQIDWTAHTAIYPPDMTADERGVANFFVQLPPGPQPAFAAYKRFWFGRMVDRYKGSRTKLIFVRLARGPIPRPGLAFEPHAAIRELGKRPNVFLTDEHAFEYLEHPELFSDYLHLNREGVQLFTPRMVQLVIQIVGRPD